MGAESSTKKLGRNRPPRVHITYDVETGPSTEVKEIPFVMGVMSDLSGDNASELPDIGDRKFSEVDAHTFDKFLKAQRPRAVFEVENTLTGEGKLKVDMAFESMDDFSPAAVAQKTEGLKQLFQAREELKSLLTTMGTRPKLEKALEVLVKDPELAKKLQAQLAEANPPANT
jgi:type VI secretion system protein ImpB